jgi:hypothetical protein
MQVQFHSPLNLNPFPLPTAASRERMWIVLRIFTQYLNPGGSPAGLSQKDAAGKTSPPPPLDSLAGRIPALLSMGKWERQL